MYVKEVSYRSRKGASLLEGENDISPGEFVPWQKNQTILPDYFKPLKKMPDDWNKKEGKRIKKGN